MREIKDSGIEWIGDIPLEWSTDRLQWHLEEIKVQNSPLQSEQVLSLTIEAGIIPYEDKGKQGNKAKENYEEYKLAYPNTLVVNSMNVIIGAVGISNYFGCVSPVYYIFKTTQETDLRYIYYLFTNVGFQKEMRKYAKGILEIRLRISSADMLKRIIPKPSYDEQQRIADFLDRKCAEIDKVIEKTTATIDEYKKLKQSIITEAVTKGIRGNRPMKDSGVEWIGNIPETYSVIKLKHLLKEPLMYGANEPGVPFDDNLPRYIRITDITMDGKLKDTGKLSLAEDSAKSYILKNNDILFARSGASVGKAFIYKENYGRSAFAGYLIKASISEKLLADYLFFYTQSSLYEEWKKQIFVQATIQNIGADRYNVLPVVLGSIEEQKEIVNYLDIKCAEIDSLISKKTEFLTQLEEYKKSVIYEYVTGKKEVK